MLNTKDLMVEIKKEWHYGYIINNYVLCCYIFLVLIISYNLGLKNNWKRKRIESVKNVGDTPRKKQPNQEKKSIKERYKQYLKSSKKEKAGKNKKRREKTNKKTSVIEGMLEMTGTELSVEQFSMLKIGLSAILMLVALIVCKILNLGMAYLILAMAVVGLVAIILPGEWLRQRRRNERSYYVSSYLI